MKLPRDDIRRMIASMELAAACEAERMNAMAEDERAEYVRERDDAMTELRAKLLADGVPPEHIAIGTTELLVALQKALDGQTPSVH